MANEHDPACNDGTDCRDTDDSHAQADMHDHDNGDHDNNNNNDNDAVLDTTSSRPGSPAVYIKNLVCGYGKNRVLHNVDFSANTDELTAIVGSNGSGKSTLLKAIFGLCDITSGSIMARGKNITRVPTHDILKHGISYMAQRKNVFQELTLLENLSVVGGRANADQAMDHFPELKPFLGRPARTLSGGQRQLLAMAMMLINKPYVMLFDEPTAALSPKNADLIIAKIRKINEENNNCIVLVEQNVMQALNYCDRVYLLASGNVVYSGDPQVLLEDKDLASKYLGL